MVATGIKIDFLSHRGQLYAWFVVKRFISLVLGRRGESVKKEVPAPQE